MGSTTPGLLAHAGVAPPPEPALAAAPVAPVPLEAVPLTPTLSVGAVLSIGLVGSAVLSKLLDRGDDEAGTDGDDEDPLMGGGDDLDGLDDGMDDWGDDDVFDDMDGAGDEETEELEHRLDELEDEVASLSSTVGTVRSENEAISEEVEEVSENVRKLLDIYEMVTRGINPFVDESAGGMAGGELGQESFDLFEEGDEAETEEALDEDIATADAEGFFDEELAEDDAAFDDASTEDQMETDDTDDGGKSFEELKDEYDDGDADWAGDEPENGTAADDADDSAEGADADGPAEGADGDDLLASDDGLEAAVDGDVAFEDDRHPDEGTLGNGSGDDPLDDGTLDGGPDEETPQATGDELLNGDGESGADGAAAATAAEAAPASDAPESGTDEPAAGAETAVDEEWAVEAGEETADGEFEFVGEEAGPEPSSAKPYLGALPEAFVGDLLVMEWLEFLVEESSATDAARALSYYERVDWISPEAADDLESYLVGFGDVDPVESDRPGTAELTLAHHTESLKYIERLQSASAESVVTERWGRLSGGDRGL